MFDEDNVRRLMREVAQTCREMDCDSVSDEIQRRLEDLGIPTEGGYSSDEKFCVTLTDHVSRVRLVITIPYHGTFDEEVTISSDT